MRYACPLTDIMYFVYLCTDIQFRKRHLQDLLDLYYKTLRIVLTGCDIDISLKYPREEYDKDIQEFMNYGFICALIELKMMTVSPEDDAFIKDIQIGQNIDSVVGELRLYALRINQLVTEFSENGKLTEL